MDQIKTGSFMKKLRKEKGLTQEQLAEQLNVSNRSVSRWETGTNLPDISILVELADFYEVDIREMIDGERKSEKMDKETKDMIDTVIDYSSEDKEETIHRILHYTNAAMVALVVGMALAMFDVMSKYSFIMIFSFYIALFCLLVIQIYSSGKQAEMKKNKSYTQKRLILLIGGLTLIGILIRILSGM